MFSVKIDASQVARGVSNVIKAIPTTNKEVCREEAEVSVGNAQGRVHVITGRLKNSLRVMQNRPYFTRFGSDLYYAGHEEFRPGHSYIMAEVHRVENGLLAARIVERLRNSV